MTIMIEYSGECMGELIASGSTLAALPGAEIWPLDLVTVLLGNVAGPWARFINALSGDGYAGLVKIYLSSYEVNGETIWLFGQLNPPTIVPIPMSAISGLHKIDFSDECVGPDLEALALLTPFTHIQTTKQ